MKSNSIIAFYSLGLIHHGFTVYYTTCQVDFSKATREETLDMQTFSNRYLTSWNLALQMFYFIMALICEILVLKKVMPKLLKHLSKIRGYFFLSILFPITMIVVFFFWSFYFIDKDLIMPIGHEEVFPFWVNHSIHTNILLLPIIEMAMPKMWVPSIMKAFLGLTIFSIFYNVMFYISYMETGKWMYNIYNYLSWPQRILLSLIMYAAGIILIIVGLHIQKLKAETSRHYQQNVRNISRKLM